MVSILLIEDDVALRKQIRFLLESKFSIFEAATRNEALEALKSHGIDIIILDLGLPPHESTPDEGLKMLEHALGRYACKVLILTGQKTEGVAIEAIKAGAFDYILKPASTEKILYAVERALLFKETEEQLQRRGIKKISLDVEMGKGLQPLRDEADKNIILSVLRDTNFNIYQSAKILGVKRESLYYFLKKFGVKRTHDD